MCGNKRLMSFFQDLQHLLVSLVFYKETKRGSNTNNKLASKLVVVLSSILRIGSRESHLSILWTIPRMFEGSFIMNLRTFRQQTENEWKTSSGSSSRQTMLSKALTFHVSIRDKLTRMRTWTLNFHSLLRR